MVDWKICFSVTISNLGLKLSKLPMPSSPLYLTCSTCSCVTLKTYKDSKSRVMTSIKSFLRSRCLTLQPISYIFIGGSFLNFVLLYERILCLETLVKGNLHVAVPEANSFSVILVQGLHGGLFVNRITSVFCWSETLIISFWSCLQAELV